MKEPVHRGNGHQQVLTGSLEWKTIEQSGSLLYNPTAQGISGISWHNLD
jgi:hypothetical protein